MNLATLDPLSDLDVDRAERLLATHAVRASRARPCRCDDGSRLVEQEEDGEVRCVVCGR